MGNVSELGFKACQAEQDGSRGGVAQFLSDSGSSSVHGGRIEHSYWRSYGCVQPMPNLKRLGQLQGLWISFLDLIHNAINAIGFPRANLWSFGGVLLFAGIVTLISEPCLSPSQNAAVGAMGKANKKGKESSVLIQQ